MNDSFFKISNSIRDLIEPINASVKALSASTKMGWVESPFAEMGKIIKNTTELYSTEKFWKQTLTLPVSSYLQQLNDISESLKAVDPLNSLRSETVKFAFNQDSVLSSRPHFSNAWHTEVMSDSLSDIKEYTETPLTSLHAELTQFGKKLHLSGIDQNSIDGLEESFDLLLKKNRDKTLTYIQNNFIDSLAKENTSRDIELRQKILRLIQRYEYSDLKPHAQSIAMNAIHDRSTKVQLDALNVIDRWYNKEALYLLKNMEAPTHPWIKQKYLSLIKSMKDDLSESTGS